jgi:AAHS family 4-hydroxybenzoate transporter-like MFS transporter
MKSREEFMAAGEKLDLESVIDAARIGRFQILVFALCALVAMADGFDTQAIAFVAPEIAVTWGVPASLFGPVFGVGLFGGQIGAILFGFVSDRYGRRPALLCAIPLFAAMSLATPFATSLTGLALLRFLTGLGLGGALPSIISITSEYAPHRLRNSVVTVMWCGFPLGAVVGGIAAAHLIPTFGWQSVFYAGGLVPLLLLPFFWALIPESVRFLAMTRDKVAIARILDRMGCAGRWNGDIGAVRQRTRLSVASLFTEGRGLGTILLWTTLFFSLLMTFFLVNWIPVIARHGGIGIGNAVLAVAMLNWGSIVGCVALGWLIDRFRPALVISLGFAGGAVAIAAIGQVEAATSSLLALTFTAGFLSIGAQMCTVAFCAGFYGTELRATGVGWSLGISRIGAIAGPVLGGMLLGIGVAAPALFFLVGAASVCAAIAMLAMGWFVLRAPRRLAAHAAIPQPGPRSVPAS